MSQGKGQLSYFFTFIKGSGVLKWEKNGKCVSSCQATNIAFPYFFLDFCVVGQ